MGGFIILSDGRAYAANNSSTDRTIEAIADAVDSVEFRQWLLDQRSSVVGGGLTNIDIREVAPKYRGDLVAAIRLAHARIPGKGTLTRWAEGSWEAYFEQLVEMVDRAEAGEPPDQFNPHMQALIPARGGQAGPGWGPGNH